MELNQLRQLEKGLSPLGDVLRGITALHRPTFNPDPFPILPIRSDNRRDPNKFYYKPNRPSKASESFELECEQLRHQTGTEYFHGEIFFSHEVGDISGALRVEVHAENLSKPVRKHCHKDKSKERRYQSTRQGSGAKTNRLSLLIGLDRCRVADNSFLTDPGTVN